MSKFFDQYSSILEKNLQRVRLKVDPLNKYAEDFAQYHGYEGYILAETEDAIKFFSNNEIVMIPKKAVMVEGILSGLAGTAQPGDTSRGTAFGTIGRNIAGTAARAVFGSQVTGTGSNAQVQPVNTQNAAPVRQANVSNISSDLANGTAIPVRDDGGTAGIVDAKRNEYYILKIVLTQSKRVLESKSFNNLLYKHAAFVQEATTPPLSGGPTKNGISYSAIISDVNFRNESAYITIMNKKTNAMAGGYGFLIGVPNTTNTVAIAFSKQP